MGGWGPGEDAPDRKSEELRELTGRSDASELGEPGIECWSSGAGEDGGEGSDAIERGDPDADAAAVI